MIHYSNIINDPYPDTIDPVTGDWLPKSYNQVKQDSIQKRDEFQQRSMLKQLLSIVK